MHELDPEYVPVIEEDEAWPVPVTLTEQVANGLSKPPAGTAIENVMDDPEIVPETVPRPVYPVLVSVSVMVPENDVDEAVVTCQTMAPGPDESEAGPLQVPPRLAEPGPGVGVGVGVGVDPLLPPQANDTSAHRTSARSPPACR